MKKRMIWLIIAALLLTGCAAEKEDAPPGVAIDENGFRQVEWGATPSGIRKGEGRKGYQHGDLLYFENMEVADLPATVTYQFAEGECQAVGYAFTQTHTDYNEFIKDFEHVKALLTELYGQPVSEDMHWYDETYQGDPAQYGKAVWEGQLEYTAEWEGEGFKVVTGLRGQETTRMNHMVMVSSGIFQ